VRGPIQRLAVGATVAAFAVVLVLPSAAGADTAPNLTCGSTQPGPCQQTAHFTNDDEFGTPLPPGSGCPAFVSEDFVHIVGTGNGVEHVNVNKAQDAWFTSTFTGNATFTAYPPTSVTVDDQGNVTGLVGPPDANVPVFSGKLTEWFGGSFNNKNSVNTGTINLSATGGGQSLSIHAVFHASWGVGTDPNGPPTRGFQNVTC
jgi:hypothetical protein